MRIRIAFYNDRRMRIGTEHDSSAKYLRRIKCVLMCIIIIVNACVVFGVITYSIICTPESRIIIVLQILHRDVRII
jgi:hypothetical protein